ncbi:subtilisin-like protein [Rhizophagus irregularis]|uniref:Subtilisin-like protein n=1 Tax=Rhizophagus irregularis TaxID=588596 RepID=A0A2N0PHS8_9GLOM|nr:subtilisin-like protein [Rhizophagus irregularis]
MNRFLIYLIIIIIYCVQAIKAKGIIKRATKHVEIVENAYLLKFSLPPSYKDDNKKLNVIKQHEYFYDEIKKKGLNITIRYEFHELINAITFEAKDDDLKSIVEINGVQSVEPVQKHRIPPISFNMIKSKYTQMFFDKRDWTTNTPLNLTKEANLNTIHKMIGVDLVHKQFGYYGKGIKVGVIDTGIDYLHPALGGCFGPGCKVEYGYNYLENTWNPRDICSGHGTHIAGIIGANDSMHSGFIGIAPQITFGAYRVMNCNGQGEGDVIMTALQRAKDDGMNIINLSLGGNGWAVNPLSEMADALTKYGIIVVTANGNYGTEGIFESGGTLLGREIASIENTHYLSFKAYDVSDKNFSIDYVTVSARAFTFPSAKIEIFPDHICPENFMIYENKVVMVNLETSPLSCPWLGILQIITARAILIIIRNETLGPTTANFNNEQIKIPTATINLITAQLIKERKKKNNDLEMDFSEKIGHVLPNPLGYSMSYYSSWGLSNLLDIKEIVTPGGMIFSTYPVPLGSYAQLSGSSMSTACVAGALALYMEANPSKNSRHARDMLTIYANPIYDMKNKEKASVLQQGTGLINVYNSIISSTLITPTRILLYDKSFSYKYLDIHNNGKRVITYNLKHCPAISINGYNGTRSIRTNYMKFNHSAAIVKFVKDKVTVQPGSSVRTYFTISSPKDLIEQGWFYSGFIQVKPIKQSAIAVTIPYAGFAGDIKSLPILGQPEFPQLRKSNKIISSNTTTPTIFTMENSKNRPIITMVISTPTKLLLIYALNFDKKIIGRIPRVNLHLVGITRYLTKTRFNQILYYEWNGNIVDLENKKNGFKSYFDVGIYYLKISALKMFGNILNESDWESWISPPIKIQRKK